jgi:hypothetical protein
VVNNDQLGSKAFFAFLEQHNLGELMPKPAPVLVGVKSLLPGEWKYDGVSTIAELVTESTDTKTAVAVLQDSIISFHQSNMTERDDLFRRAVDHLKALKTKELLEAREEYLASSTLKEETASSSPRWQLAQVTVPPVTFNYMQQEMGLLRLAREQVTDHLKTLCMKDNESVAVEACVLFFELGLYEEINSLFTRYCDPHRSIAMAFTRRITNYFDDNSDLNKRMRLKHNIK